jgi:hypothetical protein
MNCHAVDVVTLGTSCAEVRLIVSDVVHQSFSRSSSVLTPAGPTPNA